ncbi:MAG: hypothetical protein D6820_00220, partial [Lentisphaerae bacterium]
MPDKPDFYAVTFVLDELEDPIWGVAFGTPEEATGQVLRCLAAELEVQPEELVWIATASFDEDPEDFLVKCPVHDTYT